MTILGIILYSKSEYFTAKRGLGETFYAITSFFSKGAEEFKEKDELFAKMEQLKNENLELKSENNRLLLLEKENTRLSNLLDIKKRYPKLNTKGGLIIARGIGNLKQTFNIDKGEKDGIKTDMPVVSGEGLMGIITDTEESFSKVLSILDISSSVSVMSHDTEDLGVLKGDVFSEGLCVMEYIYAGAEIEVGDEIVTSYVSDKFPPGIKIGYVTEVIPDENKITLSAKVKPYSDIDRLSHVLVITGVNED